MNNPQQIDYTSETQRIGADHPCLPGHFPGNPVVPAVVGLQAVTNLLQTQRPGWQLAGIRQAKFMSPLLPEEDFVITLSGELPGIGFECHAGEGDERRLIARGSLDVTERESATA